ncbi:hypothetical protein C8R44DRAFT_878128 [Mycena epipterygia]|nr:hypothetical protein C8R44DRAFT_878128 [Mycena epipterygia]
MPWRICLYFDLPFTLVRTDEKVQVGLILGTTVHGTNSSFHGLLWMFAVARGITGFGVGGEHPFSSTSAAEAANISTLLPNLQSLLAQSDKLPSADRVLLPSQNVQLGPYRGPLS